MNNFPLCHDAMPHNTRKNYKLGGSTGQYYTVLQTTTRYGKKLEKFYKKKFDSLQFAYLRFYRALERTTEQKNIQQAIKNRSCHSFSFIFYSFLQKCAHLEQNLLVCNHNLLTYLRTYCSIHGYDIVVSSMFS